MYLIQIQLHNLYISKKAPFQIFLLPYSPSKRAKHTPTAPSNKPIYSKDFMFPYSLLTSTFLNPNEYYGS